MLSIVRVSVDCVPFLAGLCDNVGYWDCVEYLVAFADTAVPW